jgi:hypothetical protein
MAVGMTMVAVVAATVDSNGGQKKKMITTMAKMRAKATRMMTTMSWQQATINPLIGNQQLTREVVVVDNNSGSGSSGQ